MPNYCITEQDGGVQGGPREAGPHKNVWDHWQASMVTPDGSLHARGPCTVVCMDCDATWPEGDIFPEECIRVP